MIRHKNTGQLIVISAPSGSGKGTIISKLLERDNKTRWLSVSTTSRAPRSNDIPGETYNFVSKEEFEKLIQEDYFIEYTNYVGNYYGTPKELIKKKLDQGIDVILEIEIEGATNIKKIVPEALFIFIMPPSLKTMVKRLQARKTDSKDKIKRCFPIRETPFYNKVVQTDYIKNPSKIPAATAEPITPATFGPMACINR